MVALSSYLDGLSYPKLVTIILIGLILMVVSGLTTVADNFIAEDLSSSSFIVGFIGFVVFLFGATGYVSFWVFDRRDRRND